MKTVFIWVLLAWFTPEHPSFNQLMAIDGNPLVQAVEMMDTAAECQALLMETQRQLAIHNKDKKIIEVVFERCFEVTFPTAKETGV